jgi:hypothetical protein
MTAEVPVLQTGEVTMPDIVIFNWNVASAIPYKPKHLVVPALPVQVALRDDPALQRAVAADPLLQQRMADLCKAEFLQAATVIDRQFAASDAKAAGKGALEIQRLQRELEEVTRLSVKAVADTASRKIITLWEQLGQERTDYRKYQIKSGLKVTLGTGGVALGVAGVVVGLVAGGGVPTPSLAVGLVGLWRGMMDLSKTLLKLALEAETVGTSVCASLKRLRDTYKSAPAKPAAFGTVAIREAGVTVLNVVLQTEMANIPQVRSQCDLWKSKLQGLRTTAHDLAKKLNEFLAQSEQLEKGLAPVARTPQNAAKIAAASARIDLLQGKVSELLVRIPTIHRRAEDGMLAQQEAASGLNLLAMKAPGWTTAFDKALPIMANLGLSGGSAALGFVEASRAVEFVLTSASLVNDIASNVNDAA